MLVTGFNITLKHGKEVAKLYVDSWNEVVNGELDEVTFNKKDVKNLKEASTKSKIFEAYNKIIDLKTAVLFSSACKAGAIEANMSGDILNVFSNYGREIGRAYQLADDLVDLANGEMIDSVIVPLLNRLEHKKIKIGTMEKREIKKEFLKNQDKIQEKREIKKEFLKNQDKIQEFYIAEIKKHVRKAEELGKSEAIPSSPYKDMLTDAPTYIINRMLREINVTI